MKSTVIACECRWVSLEAKWTFRATFFLTVDQICECSESVVKREGFVVNSEHKRCKVSLFSALTENHHGASVLYVYLHRLLAEPRGLQIERSHLACTSCLSNQRIHSHSWWNAFWKGHLFTFVKVTSHYLPIAGVGCSPCSAMLSFTSAAGPAWHL